MNYFKYRPYTFLDIPDRQWPGRRITKSPKWCSVDLRDGNQALEVPMTLEQKVRFFGFLVDIGFKEIEVGFPAASDTEFSFVRTLIEQKLIPDDVVIQVLMQSREHIIKRSFEALEGVKKAVVHLYNSTSTLQREVVFQKSKEEIKELAVFGAALIRELADQYGKEHYIFEYSPESFSGTETDYAAEVCNAVIKEWQGREIIINLPNTVEMAPPNVFADQIEYMCNHLIDREKITVSLHTHNDRGTAVAASELGLLAGADRIEGTLFGNGERTGNADIMNIALNMHMVGIDTGLDFSKIDDVIDVYERSTGMNVHSRHPYAGKLVYTAFSGSHQDAINKGLAKMKDHPERWEVPYLPIDPMDVGRSYDPIIRINSQSGKGGVAYILERNYGMKLPRKLQEDFGIVVTNASDTNSKELNAQEIHKLFLKSYIVVDPLKLEKYSEVTNGCCTVTARIKKNGTTEEIQGSGEGLIDAFCDALKKQYGIDFEITDYNEHALEYSSKSRAITYIQISSDGKSYFGAGISSNISESSLHAIVSAVNSFINRIKVSLID